MSDFPQHRLTSPLHHRLWEQPDIWHWWALYLGLATALWSTALTLPRPDGTVLFFLTLGGLAAWRYSWWSLHQIRALIFLHRVYPRLQARATAAAAYKSVPHLYVVVLSYGMSPQMIERCYRGLCRAALNADVPTTIIASVTSNRDVRILNRVYADLGAPTQIRFHAQFQDGKGKRRAISEALRAISRDALPPGAIVTLMDGDVVLAPDAFSKSLPFFLADPGLDAITTNNRAEVTGTPIAQQWFALRLAQRHALMASMALSKRLLVLTGRFSLFRAEIATSEAFVQRVEADRISHWRHGEITFLTGDDKSTWFQVLCEGRRMLYLPDVYATGIEALPAPGKFFPASSKLMTRWFGNMLRANGRAIGLGPRRVGPFVWWALIDQRLSIWTALTGPISTLFLCFYYSPVFAIYYLALAFVTRGIMSAMAGAHYGRFHPSWPFLMYYNQVWGGMLKSVLTYHLDRQSWTRQAIKTRRADRLSRTTGWALHAATLACFALAVGTMIGVITDVSPGTTTEIARLLRL
ncbi:glycosyltransferase Alg8 [Rhodobacter sp. JA431]|uniref:glycosyltransferase n=1 Tax=Rhodobacter sp. JA431 TaxID=570013 RepID=UPI000BC67C02|nr:glycosyltransferase [Rhodobacter sp. JA431]SOB91589.1 glycosyltransferase Alg8 [Rhodobacter sp. JA431]